MSSWNWSPLRGTVNETGVMPAADSTTKREISHLDTYADATVCRTCTIRWVHASAVPPLATVLQCIGAVQRQPHLLAARQAV